MISLTFNFRLCYILIFYGFVLFLLASQPYQESFCCLDLNGTGKGLEKYAALTSSIPLFIFAVSAMSFASAIMDVFWQSWRCQIRSLQARLKLIRPNNLERIQILADEFSKSSNYTSWWTFATSVGLSFSAFVVDLLNMSMVILLTQDGNSFALMGGGQNDCANLRYFKIVTNLVIIHYSTLAIGDFVNFMKDFFPFGRSTFKRLGLYNWKWNLSLAQVYVLSEIFKNENIDYVKLEFLKEVKMRSMAAN